MVNATSYRRVTVWGHSISSKLPIKTFAWSRLVVAAETTNQRFKWTKYTCATMTDPVVFWPSQRNWNKFSTAVIDWSPQENTKFVVVSCLYQGKLDWSFCIKTWEYTLLDNNEETVCLVTIILGEKLDEEIFAAKSICWDNGQSWSERGLICWNWLSMDIWNWSKVKNLVEVELQPTITNRAGNNKKSLDFINVITKESKKHIRSQIEHRETNPTRNS